MRFLVSEAEIIHRDSLQLKWQPSRRVKFDLLYLLAITNKVSWGCLWKYIHICKFKNIYTTRWSTIDPKFEDVMPAFHGRFFLTFYPFSVQEHNKWVGTKNFIQTVQIRTALMFRVLGVAWNNQFRSSWSCHPTARSGGRQDNTMIMAYADSLYKYKYI